MRTKFYLILSLFLPLSVCSVSAQSKLSDVKELGSSGFVDGDAAQKRAVKNTTTQGEETFGERALRIFKSKGRPLPLPEEKILKLKPGRSARVSVPDQYKGLVFIGMCHYAQGADGRITTPYGFYKMAADNGFQREQYVDVNACLNVSFVYYSHKLGGVSTIPLPYVNPDGRVYYYEWDATFSVYN